MATRSRGAILAAVMVTAIVLPSTAAAAIDQVSVSPKVLLGPEGASATASVAVQCTEGLSGFVAVDLEQNKGGRLASGFGGADLTCTGALQILAVKESFSIFALKQGKATATATVLLFDPVTFDPITATSGPVSVRVHK